MHPVIKRLFIHPPFIPLLFFVSFIDGFWTQGNLSNLAGQISLDGILVAGLVIVMIAAGFDLSIGVVMAVSGVVAIALAPYGLGWAIIGSTITGLIAGLLNGTLIARFKINPFIASFATMIMMRGAVLYYTDTRPTVYFDPLINSIGRGKILGIPYAFLIMLIVMVILHVVLTTRAWGRHVYAIGSDDHAARLAGLPVSRIRIQVYILCSCLAALTGALLAAKLATGSPIVGASTALFIAAAALLGGATLQGGQGSIPGAFVGVLFISVLVNAMNLLIIPAYFQRISIGLLLIFLVVLDGAIKRWKLN